VATVAEIIKKTEAYLCQDCGKCSSVCPISRLDSGYSPRRIITNSLKDTDEKILSDNELWSCLTCARCLAVCPQAIDYMELTKGFRTIAQHKGEEPICSHSGALQSIMRLMTTPSLDQHRLDWLPKTAKVKSKGDILLFVGCAPYFDTYFADIEVHTLSAAKSTIALLNSIGIEPVLLPDERCCGHDLLWGGDVDNFLSLAKQNLETIKNTGAKKVLFTCAECFRTFKVDMEKHFGSLGFETEHISTFLEPYVKEGKLQFKAEKQKVTYQDPCRLGRHLGIYDAPRTLITSVPKVELVELDGNREHAICCGTNAWLNCDSYSKRMQMQRIQNAIDKGAKVLTVACPKCEIHFKCTMNEKSATLKKKIDVQYFTNLLSNKVKS
jgi:heterodisulfide reductase subunit D